jgi:DNA-binding NtrC family response regulator
MASAKILVADDEENFLRLALRTLKKEGYDVRTAKDGKKALKCVESEPFDLALLDLQMPGIDGLTTLKEIKRRYPHLKVIMITAYPSPGTQSESRRAGACDYLIKPVDIFELKAAIRRALSSLTGLFQKPKIS